MVPWGLVFVNHFGQKHQEREVILLTEYLLGKGGNCAYIGIAHPELRIALFLFRQLAWTPRFRPKHGPRW